MQVGDAAGWKNLRHGFGIDHCDWVWDSDEPGR